MRQELCSPLGSTDDCKSHLLKEKKRASKFRCNTYNTNIAMNCIVFASYYSLVTMKQ